MSEKMAIRVSTSTTPTVNNPKGTEPSLPTGLAEKLGVASDLTLGIGQALNDHCGLKNEIL